MSFSLKLKELRENKGLTQRELADKLGVGVGTVGMWESTTRVPPAVKLKAVADYFGVSIDYLLERDLITPKEKAQGASDTRNITISPAEDELIYMFREAGKKYGSAAQQTILDMVQGILKL